MTARSDPHPLRGVSAPAWVLPAILLLATCGWLGLLEPTETRYAEIAREMMASGNWLIPRLDGIAHFHKPPLAYWAAAAGMSALGQNEWGARLGVAVAAAFMLWATAGLSRLRAVLTPETTGSAAAGSASVLLASSLLFFAISRQLASDIFLSASVAGFHWALLHPRTRNGAWPFVALATGFMAKGPVVFLLTVVPVWSAALWSGEGGAARPLSRGRGWTLFALLALPWYLAVTLETPGLLHYLLKHQLWERYATTIHHRSGPSYYFLGVLLGGALPWTWAALAGGWRAARRARPMHRFDCALLVSWVAFPLVFFSTSGSKLPAYLLPVFPAVALLAAPELRGDRRQAMTRVTAFTLFALGLAIEVVGPWGLRYAVGFEHQATPLPVGGHLAAFALFAAAQRCWKGRSTEAATLSFVALLAIVAALRPYDASLGSPRELAGVLARQRRAGEPVVEFARFNAGLPFYLRERTPLLEVARELQFDSDTTSGIGRDDLRRHLERNDRVWVLAPLGRAQELGHALGARTRPVATWRGQALAILEAPIGAAGGRAASSGGGSSPARPAGSGRPGNGSERSQTATRSR